MKNKSFWLTILILMALQYCVHGQVSKQDAITFVFDSIVGNDVGSVNIFMEENVQNSTNYLRSSYDTLTSSYTNYWVFFIDEQPEIQCWEHDCKYVFIDTISGQYTTITHNLPPTNYIEVLDSISFSFNVYTDNDTITPITTAYSNNDNSHYYAVMFVNAGFRGWNALSHYYVALMDKGYKKENVYVIMNEGIEDNSLRYLDLDGDGEGDILEDYECSKSSLEYIFGELENKMNEDDLLFMYSFTHGTQTEGGGYNETTLHLLNEELTDAELVEMMEDINYAHLIYAVLACNAGGVIDDFQGPHNMAIACTEWGMTYAGQWDIANNTGLMPFDYGIGTTLRGYHPLNDDHIWENGHAIGEYDDIEEKIPHLTDDINYDLSINGGNADGKQQMIELVKYAEYIDEEFNNEGIYAYDCGFDEDLLSLTGISGNVETTQTIEGNFLIGGNLNLETGTTLTVDNETKLFLVNGSISTESSSTLILKDDVLVHNFSEEAGFSVNGALQGDVTAGADVEYVTFSSAPATSLFMGVLTDVTFSACVFDHIALSGSGYTLVGGNDLIINQSSAFSHSLILGPGHYNIANCTFSYSSIDFHPGPAMSWNCSAFIKNSSFYLPHPDKNNIISLSSVQEFNIEGDTFSNYADQYNGGSSLLLEYCGNSGTSSWHQIKDNIFTTIEDQTYSNTNGISLYSSNAYINNNNIQYQQNGLSLYGNCQTNVTGSDWATSESGTQQIKNNSNLQVYASEYAFPNLFKYNVVYEDTYSQTYILHDLVPGHYPVENVECNYWGNTDPGIHLLPLNHYDYTPIWEFTLGCNEPQTAAAALYQTGVNQVADSNYNAAQSTFEEVVTDYPDTEPANNAMKELLLIEALVDSTDYSGRQDWFLTEPAILGNNRLKKIGENLANKCDEKLENYPDAIDWYEDMIDDPPSLQDSVFAIIDLENVYLEMGIDTNLRSAYMGRMPQYKPVSINAHQKHRDELLALLGNVNKNNIDDSFPETEENSKPVELLKNTPNPFTGTTQISYNLKIESDVQLIVYTYTGQLVKTINIGTKTKGTHLIVFDASGLKSGIYFYSMNINGQTIIIPSIRCTKSLVY